MTNLLPKGNVQVCFSGGRTSGMMLYYLLPEIRERDDVRVIFTNTGRERRETLEFVLMCEAMWRVPVVWLEYRHDGSRPAWKAVNASTVSECGRPFSELIVRKMMCPNVMQRFCTQELKIRTAKRYLVSIGWKSWSAAIGIRADEQRRIGPSVERERQTPFYPLNEIGVTRRDVQAFWAKQPFDLNLPIHEGITIGGNCDGCFLQSEASRAALYRDEPARYQWWIDQEKIASDLNKNGESFFRKGEKYTDLSAFVERQGDWIFDAQNDALCQVDGGECTA